MQAKAQFMDDASYAALASGTVRVRIQFVPFDQAQHDALAAMLKDAQVAIVGSSLGVGAGGPLWMDIGITGKPKESPDVADVELAAKLAQINKPADPPANTEPDPAKKETIN